MGSIKQSIEIGASVDQVWQAIRNFHDMSWAPNVITGFEVVEEKQGDELGAIRVLNGVFRETLLSLDDAGKTFTYSIDDGPSPISSDEVKDYVGMVVVRQADDENNTQVEWSSSWLENDESVSAFCLPIYTALLQDMKQSLE